MLRTFCRCAVAWVLLCSPAQAAHLTSWYDGAARKRLLDFVDHVTTPGDAMYVPPAERVAAFDNDGTLWAEKPQYFPLLFAIDRIRTLAADHPQWAHTAPFSKVLRDVTSDLSYEEMRILQEVALSGSTTEAFYAQVDAWLNSARHPALALPYAALTYVPMLELMALLRAHDFSIFLCSGAETEFVRPVARRLYGVGGAAVIGTNLALAAQWQDGILQLLRLPSYLAPLNEGPGKAFNLQRHLGARPLVAVGNSDGDLEMLQFAARPQGPSLSVLLHHDDAEREFAYDRGAERALAEAAQQGWLVVSMRDDFRRIFAD